MLETDVMIFPILHNNDMVAQFFVCKIEETDEWYVQLDSNLVEQTLENVESDQFCYIYDDEGVTTNQMVTWFNTHYGMNYAKGSANPNPSTIVNELLAGYPSHGRFTRTVNGVTNSHAVVIRGCNTSANTFSVMNPTPTTSGYTTGNILSGNVYRFISAYSSSTYTLADRSYRYGL